MPRASIPLLLLSVGIGSGAGWCQTAQPPAAASKPALSNPPAGAPAASKPAASKPAPTKPKRPRKRAKAAKAEAEELTPLTLWDVLSRLKKEPGGEAPLVDAVKRRGVDFTADSELRTYLRKKGASEEFLDLLPQPPKPKTAGPLAILCSPVDCDVVVNDRYYGTTERGRKQLSGVPAGEVSIRVYANGYNAGEKRVKIGENQALQEEFVLRQNGESESGQARLKLVRALTGLGGIEGLIDLASATVSGSVEYSLKGADSTRWNMKMSHTGTGLSLTFQGPEGNCTVQLKNDTGISECRGKARRTTANEDLVEITGFLHSFELPVVLGQMLAGTLAGPQPGGTVVSQTPGGAYFLDLSEDALPAKVEFRSTDGKVRFQVAYSNYQKVGKAQQPRRVEFTRGNDAKPFMVVLFEGADSSEPARSRT